MLNQRGTQPSTFEGGLDDLEGFQAWAEEIKTYLSQAHPALYEVLEQSSFLKGTYRRREHDQSFSRHHERQA